MNKAFIFLLILFTNFSYAVEHESYSINCEDVETVLTVINKQVVENRVLNFECHEVERPFYSFGDVSYNITLSSPIGLCKDSEFVQNKDTLFDQIDYMDIKSLKIKEVQRLFTNHGLDLKVKIEGYYGKIGQKIYPKALTYPLCE